jgi:HEAT repeat protein
MHRRRVITQSLLGVGLVVLALGLIWTLTLNRQPLREGRTVTDWSLDLLSPSPSTRTNAALVMKSFGPEAVPFLTRQLERRDSWLRDPFLSVSSQLPVSWRRAFVRAFQPFRSREERLAAATALVFHGTNVPVDLLLEVLRYPDRQLAGQAAAALGGYGAGAVPGLTIALRESDPQLQRLACYAISQMGSTAEPAAPQLAALLADPDPQTTAMAAHALGMIGAASIPHFVLALDNPHPRVREKAAVGLAQFRLAATNAVPALELLLEDEDTGVRRAAALALHAIAPRRSDEFGARHPSRDF